MVDQNFLANLMTGDIKSKYEKDLFAYMKDASGVFEQLCKHLANQYKLKS